MIKVGETVKVNKGQISDLWLLKADRHGRKYIVYGLDQNYKGWLALVGGSLSYCRSYMMNY